MRTSKQRRLYVVVTAFVAAVATGYLMASAAPPGSTYTPGETLDPSCAPGDTNCTVQAPITGTSTSGNVTYWNGTSTVSGSNNLFWDITNSRLGIGTTTPSTALQVVGSTTLSGTNRLLQIGSAPTIQGGITTLDNLINVSKTFSDTAFSSVGVMQGLWNPPTDTASGVNGLDVEMQVADASTASTTGQLVAVQGRVEHFGVGTIDSGVALDGVLNTRSSGGYREAIGTFVGVTAGGTGSVTNAYGVQAVHYGFGGTITNAYGVFADSDLVIVGSIVNAAGLVAQEQTGGSNNTNVLIGTAAIPTGSFSIYNSSTRNNYFAGKLGIATTTPAVSLQVDGSARTKCLQVMNSDGSATVNYVTVLNGTLTATTTKPSICE